MKLIDAKATAKMLGRKENWVRDRTQDRWPKAHQIPHFRFPGSRMVAFHEEIVQYWHEHGCPAWDGSYPPTWDRFAESKEVATVTRTSRNGHAGVTRF